MMNTLLHELGTVHDKTVVMIHGTGMSWDMPHSAANLLAEHDHVILVSVPGHDPRTSEEFTSVEQTAEEGYGLIAASGMPIRPRDDEEYFKSMPKMAEMQAVMFAIAKKNSANCARPITAGMRSRCWNGSMRHLKSCGRHIRST